MNNRDIMPCLVVCIQYFSAPYDKIFFSNIYKNIQVSSSQFYFLLGSTNHDIHGTISKHPFPICSPAFSSKKENRAYEITILSVCALPFQLLNQLTDIHENW
jgi:hypothetical protein